MNSYWIYSVGAAAYILNEYGTKFDAVILDQWPTWNDLIAPPLGRGLDLVASVAHLHRAGINIHTGKVVVDTSTDWGNSWQFSFEIPTTPSADTIPTLMVDRWNRVYCFFHKDGPAIEGWVSDDFGQKFTHWFDLSSKKHPRARSSAEGVFIFCHNGDDLEYRELFYDGTTNLLATVTGVPEQLVAFSVDPWNTHVATFVWTDGNVYQVFGQNGVLNPKAEIIPTRERPNTAGGTPISAIATWHSTVPVAFQAGPTISDPGTEVGLALPVTGQHLGLAVDRWGGFYAMGRRPDGTYALLTSRDAQTWG